REPHSFPTRRSSDLIALVIVAVTMQPAPRQPRTLRRPELVLHRPDSCGGRLGGDLDLRHMTVMHGDQRLQHGRQHRHITSGAFYKQALVVWLGRLAEIRENVWREHRLEPPPVLEVHAAEIARLE